MYPVDLTKLTKLSFTQHYLLIALIHICGYFHLGALACGYIYSDFFVVFGIWSAF